MFLRFLSFLSVSLLLSACGSSSLTASRDAWQGCEWREVSNVQAQLLVMACSSDEGEKTLLLDAVNDGFAPVVESGVSSTKTIEILQNPKALSAKEVLMSQFINILETEAKDNCSVKESQFQKREGVQRFTLIPSQEYFESLSQNSTGPVLYPCGPYSGFGVNYFEFHEATKDKFFYVRVGQDQPAFDEQSLEFL